MCLICNWSERARVADLDRVEPGAAAHVYHVFISGNRFSDGWASAHTGKW